MFVLSFCRHTKTKTFRDGLLSQWRGYAGSAGFAIEFDEEPLDKLILAENKQFAYPVMKSDEVLYEDYEHYSTAKCIRELRARLSGSRLPRSMSQK
jgi:hypothetical protein